MTFNLYF